MNKKIIVTTLMVVLVFGFRSLTVEAVQLKRIEPSAFTVTQGSEGNKELKITVRNMLNELHLQLQTEKMGQDTDIWYIKNILRSIKIDSNNIDASDYCNVIELKGIDMKYYDEILKLIDGENEVDFFQIIRISTNISDNNFSVWLQTTGYCILKGDTLWGIAQKTGTSVERLLELNPQIKNPDLIFPYRIIQVNK